MTSDQMINEVSALLLELQPTIDDDYRASTDTEDDIPGMQVTIATTDGSDWAYQTGDNSYTGSCYHHPYWGVMYLYRPDVMDEAAVREEARRGVEEMLEQMEACNG